MSTLTTGLPASVFSDYAIGGSTRLLAIADGISRTVITDGITAWEMGVNPPAAAPTFNSKINGSLDESAVYYVAACYRRSIHAVIGNASTTSAAMTTGTAAASEDGLRINILADSAVQTGVDQAEIYRTLGSGTTLFYNSRETYSGSTITADLTIADSALGAAIEIDNNIPEARPYITFFDGRFIIWGSIPYSTGSVTMAASTTVAGSGTAFTKGMVGKTFKVDTDSKEYTISAWVSATEITLSEAYTGTTGAGKTYTISLEPLILAWSKIDSSGNMVLESFPTANIDKAGGGANAGNEKPVGLGQTASFILPMTNRNVYYTRPKGANEFYALQVLHSGVGCMEGAFRTIVTASKTGDCIWLDQNAAIRRSTGSKGEPYDLSKFFIANILDGTHDGIHNDIKVDTSKYADFHALDYGFRSWYMLWVTLSGETYPTACLICDLSLNPTGDPKGPSPWMLWDGLPAAICSGMRLDSNGNLRPYIGDDYGFIWQLDTGTNDYGVSTTGKTTTGTPTSVSPTVLTDTGATFPTTGNGLKGTRLRTYNATTLALENNVFIQSNTATALTVTAWDSTPTTTSIYVIGGIVWERYDKAQHDGSPKDVKTTSYLDITTDKAASSYYLKVHHFTDLSSTAVVTAGRNIDVSINTRADTIPDNARGQYHQRKYSNFYADEPIVIRNITRDSELRGRR